MRKALITLLALALLIMIAVIAAPSIPRLRDFDQTFYPAIRYTLAGQNPYTAYYEMTDQGAPPSFFNPPWLLLILLPFGLFPLTLAHALWVVFLIGITFVAASQLKWWGLKGIWPLALVALPWSLIGILFGQVTSLVFLGAVLCIVEVTKPDRRYQSGLIILLGLALVGIKPQLGILIALPLLLWLWRQRDKRLRMIVIGGGLVLGLAFVVTPPWLMARAVAVQQITAPHWKSTLERELLLWQLPTWIAWIIRAIVVAVMVLWVRQAKNLTPSWWSAWLAAVLIITPYTRAYDGVLLLPILGQLIAQHKLRTLAFLIILVLYSRLPFGELGSVMAPLVAWWLFVPWHSLIANVVPDIEPSAV
jgi:hypothetical protein